MCRTRASRTFWCVFPGPRIWPGSDTEQNGGICLSFLGAQSNTIHTNVRQITIIV